MSKFYEYKSRNSTTSSLNNDPQLSKEDLRRLYSTALQLFGNKKITKDNAFSLKLLDCFGHLVGKELKNTDDINSVARALEACSKIFSCRVDLAHSTLLTITNDIIHKTVSQSQPDDDADHGESSAKANHINKDEQANNDAHSCENKAINDEAEYNPIDIDLDNPFSYRGFDENGDEIFENDVDDNKEGGQGEEPAGINKKKVLSRWIETNEYELSLESEVSKGGESHALKKFRTQFHDSIKTRKPDDFFFQYEKLAPSYSARLQDPDALREELTNLLEPVEFPKTLELTEDLVDLQFYDVNLDIDFDPTIHNIWGYERQDSEDEDENIAASVALSNSNEPVIENEPNDLDLQYNPDDRPVEYSESTVGPPLDVADLMSEITIDDNDHEEGEELGVSIGDLKNLDQLEVYFNKIRATKDKKVDIFRIFANNLTSARQKLNKPNEIKDKLIAAPEPLTIKEMSVFRKAYKLTYKNLNVNKDDWRKFDSVVPIGSFRELNDLEFSEYAELSKSVETLKINGKIVQSKGGQATDTKEHYRYFMDRDRNILEIMKKHPKGYENIANQPQLEELVQDQVEKDNEEENGTNYFNEAVHFEGFEPDGDDGDVRDENAWGFDDFPEKNARLVFDRKSGGFVDLANPECFEEGNEFTTAHSDIINIVKSAVDMHFLKTVIESIVKKRFDKNSPLKDADYTFDELLIDIWRGDFMENARENVSPSIALASFLHVCAECGFSLERVVGADFGYESQQVSINDEEKENDITTTNHNHGQNESNTIENEPKMENEILYIRPPKDVDFVPSPFVP